MKLPHLVAVGLALAAAAPLHAQAPHVDRLLVANKEDHSVSVFDPASGEELAVLPTGKGPHEVAVSPDGRTAVVTDYGDRQPGRTLTVIDVRKAEVRRTLEPRYTATTADGAEESRPLLRPHGCLFTAPTQVLITSERARQLALVDVERGEVLRTWPTPQKLMHMVATTADHRLAAATSIPDGSVALFDLLAAEQKPPRVVATGDGAEGLAVNPKTGEVWVGNRAANTVSIVDPATGAVAATLETGDFPFRLAFTPDGRFALVSCAEGDAVQVFDTRTRERVASIPIAGDGSEEGAVPMGLCVDPEGARCYVTCGRGEHVAVIDLAARRVERRMKGRPGADGIAYARVMLTESER